MSDVVVEFDGVWKKFRRGERHDSLRDLVPGIVSRIVRGRPDQSQLQGQEFWAVRDVSFQVRRGEALGIIGPNGAGKSTALKLLTRILRPTIGKCSVKGRVGALIEVAAGFHGDLTGRENIYLQGAIMGMRKAQIEAKLEEIIDFSGIAPFIDTQVKRYSSGMQARLGFSVAAHMDPDVLFVDEVLSVGDMSFQAKCMERMRQQIDSGVTVIFVSHNLQAVALLCKRCVVMGAGTLLFDGPPEPALSAYLQASQAYSTRYNAESRMRVVSSNLIRLNGRAEGPLEPHESCELRVTLECVADVPPCTIGLEIERTRDLFYCYGTSAEDFGLPLRAWKAGERSEFVARFDAHLARGHYRMNLNVRDPKLAKYFMVAESVASFTVDEHTSYDGVVDIGLSVGLA